MKDVFKLSQIIPNFHQEEKDLFEEDPFYEGAEFMNSKLLIDKTIDAYKFRKGVNRKQKDSISFMFTVVDDDLCEKRYTSTAAKGIVKPIYEAIDIMHQNGKQLNDYITEEKPLRFKVVKGRYFLMLQEVS